MSSPGLAALLSALRLEEAGPDVFLGRPEALAGLRISCLCPDAVSTGMFGRQPEDDAPEVPDMGAPGELLTPEGVADTCITAMTGDGTPAR